VDYCSVADLYAHGLPRGSIPNRGRVAIAANPTTDTIPLGDHALSPGDEFTVRPGPGGGSLPAPLVEDVVYFALPVNANTFKVADTAGGGPIDLTSAGSQIVIVTPINYAASISYASRLIDEMLVGHVLIEDGDPIPEIIRMTCAEIAIGKLALISGSVSKSLGEIVDYARKRLDVWAKGNPLRAKNKPAPANLATSAATMPIGDARGWNNGGRI
jgi:hypothetical protein